jgi:hypothetical protein
VGGHAEAVDWLDERYDDLAYDDTRSHSSGQAHFAVEVANVGSSYGGPVEPMLPSDLPYPDWFDVETVDVDVLNHPVSQPLARAGGGR